MTSIDMSTTLEQLCQKYISNPDQDVVKIMHECNVNKLYSITIAIGTHYLNKINRNVNLYDLLSLAYYYENNPIESLNTIWQGLYGCECNDETFKRMYENSRYSVDKIGEKYVEYPDKIVANLNANEVKSEISLNNLNIGSKILFSITTCKRRDLFEKSMNSFLNCCLDISKITKWLCVDDNSSKEDRDWMCETYPFIEFIFKTEDQKGHAKSLNIILDIAKNYDYHFQMEDDWLFVYQDFYIQRMLNVLNSNEKVGQCLINRNYAEDGDGVSLVGSERNYTKERMSYFIHSYIENEEDRPKARSSCHWPHFSLRPGLIRTSVYEKIGRIDDVSGFEFFYGVKYSEKYVSAFLPGIFSIHIGKKIHEDGDNAYSLNDETR